MRSPLVALLAAVASFAPSFVAAEEGTPTLTAAARGAEQRVHPRMPWRAVRVGAPVRFGAELRCAEGCAVRWGDGTIASLDPGAIAVVEEQVHMRFVAGEAAVRSDRLSLRAGSAWIDRPASASRPMTLGDAQGPIGAAGVGRTRVVAGAGKTSFASQTSSGFQRTGHGWAVLPARHALTAAPGQPTKVRPLLAAPVWAASDRVASVAIAAGTQGTPVGGAWRPLAGAAKYRIEIARDAKFADRIDAPITDATFFAAKLEPGAYWMRVVGIDADGLESATSTSRRIGVVRATLPAGGSISGKRITLPEGASTKLGDAPGVEAALQGGGFMPARMVPFAAAEGPRTLRLRVHGDPLSETTFSIEPRALRAKVRLAPALPKASDPIDITVEVDDPSGVADVKDLDPRLAVMIGVQPVPVRFAELPNGGRGRVFHARLGPQRAKGPSVVRVAVSDEDGVEIGRGFVEVAAR